MDLRNHEMFSPQGPEDYIRRLMDKYDALLKGQAPESSVSDTELKILAGHFHRLWQRWERDPPRSPEEAAVHAIIVPLTDSIDKRVVLRQRRRELETVVQRFDEPSPIEDLGPSPTPGGERWSGIWKWVRCWFRWLFKA